MVKRIVGALVLMVLCLSSFPSFLVWADGVPLEPSIDLMRGWQPARDRNVLVTFDDYEFKHHMVSTPVPFPKCKQVQIKGREVWLLTPDIFPSLYMIELEANAYRKRGDTDWEGMTGKTSGWIKDYQDYKD